VTLVVGAQLPEQTFAVDRAQLIRYAGASGDFNPIHWDEHAARAAGLPDVLAHGMLAMALAGRTLTDWLADPGRIIDFKVRFAAPLPVAADAPTTIVGGGEVTELCGDGTARIRLYLRCGATEILSQAEAVVRPH
jgi:acyl dehydratase